MAAEYQAEALSRLETAAEWVPRLLYVGILLYVGWSIIKMYQGYISDLGKIIDGN